VLSIALWENDRRAEINRHAPKPAQQFALDLNSFHPVGLFWRIRLRYHAIHQHAYFVVRALIDAYLLNIAIEIAGRDVEKTPSHIPVDPDRAAVAALTFRIHVQDRLDIVVACWHLGETLDWMPKGGLIDDRGLTRLKTVNVDTKIGIVCLVLSEVAAQGDLNVR
jgi:hypothetical protein